MINLVSKLFLSLVPFICIFLCAPLYAADEKRVALIIGNSDYASSPLRNPVNDATDVAQLLKNQLGFSTRLLINASQAEIERAIRDFSEDMKNADVRIFYFAGHGVSVDGGNYMIPIGAEIQHEDDVQWEAVNTSLVLEQMEKSNTGANVMILDACRDNPLPKSTRSTQSGLEKMQAPVGSLILYATAPGQVALDGRGRNGTFTKHLLRSLAEPNVHIGDIALDVRVAVMKETGNLQVPWSESSLTRRIYLAGQQSDPEGLLQSDDNPSKDHSYESSMLLAYRDAADAGDWDAVVNLGVTYLMGEGVAVDQQKAYTLFSQAASAGHSDAQRSLGSMYQFGVLVPVNYDRALSLYKQAAGQGNVNAYIDLGDIYSRGLGVSVNNEIAFMWYERAAEKGMPVAQAELGYLYSEGLGVPQDYEAALKWYKKSAEQKNPTGIYNLAEMYELGLGVAVDLNRATTLYKQAQSLGEPNAFEALSRLGQI